MWPRTGLGLTRVSAQNICVVDLEAQGLEKFPEWQGKLKVSLEQVGQAEVDTKDLKAALGDANSTQNRYEDELTLIFDKLSVLQEGFIHNIHTMTEIFDKVEASILMGFTDQESSQLEALVDQISDVDKDKISYCLCIDGLDSRLNEGADELAIG